jgi:hypothetical protein
MARLLLRMAVAMVGILLLMAQLLLLTAVAMVGILLPMVQLLLRMAVATAAICVSCRFCFIEARQYPGFRAVFLEGGVLP